MGEGIMEKRNVIKDVLPLIIAVISGIVALAKVSAQVDATQKWVEKHDPVIAHHSEAIVRADERYKNIEQNLSEIKRILRDRNAK